MRKKIEDNVELIWSGKQEMLANYSEETDKKLVLKSGDGINENTTENLYIEGDNLEVLKILQKNYKDKIKLIYIDPPYNTGKNFIYKDKFGGHSAWINFIYPRLKLARNLLTDDGVIFISIDENEFNNLKKICDEIFGEWSFIENFIWIKNSTKNLSKTTSTNHEYVLCYAKNKSIVEEHNLFKLEKPGLKEVQAILLEANQNKLSIEETEQKLKNFYKSRNDLKGISMYDRVEYRFDEILGQNCLKAYTLDNSSAPKSTGKADTYEVLHPITGKPCKVPSRGWRFKQSTMNKMIKNNLIEFYNDENHVPRVKRFLNNVELEVMKSSIEDFMDGKKELIKLFGDSPFDNPKPTTLMSKFIKSLQDVDIVMDFFSGSATTAHAVMQLNAEDGGKRKFILVNIPEECKEGSEAYKQGFKNICEIGKERIRRAGKKIKEEFLSKKDITEEEKQRIENLDIGFRVLKLDSK